MKGCISFFHVGAARTIDDESLHLSSGGGLGETNPPPRRPRLDHRSNPVDAAGDAMPESANDASGTRFSAGGGGGDDDDDDERADIVDEYRARIIASPFRSPVGFCLSGRRGVRAGFGVYDAVVLVSCAHTLVLYYLRYSGCMYVLV